MKSQKWPPPWLENGGAAHAANMDGAKIDEGRLDNTHIPVTTTAGPAQLRSYRLDRWCLVMEWR